MAMGSPIEIYKTKPNALPRREERGSSLLYSHRLSGSPGYRSGLGVDTPILLRKQRGSVA
jgi:hypothetical protein